MPTVKEFLINAIEDHKEELITRTCNRLQTFSPSHYEVISFEQHQEREERFLNVILGRLREEDESESLSHYIEFLVEQRSNEGYSLVEIEQAFDIVEDTLWEVLVKYWPLEQSLIEALSLIRKFFHETKNSFAQLFLRDALTTQKQVSKIHQKFAEYREIHDHESSGNG
jgi:hypothetical protein